MRTREQAESIISQSIRGGRKSAYRPKTSRNAVASHGVLGAPGCAETRFLHHVLGLREERTPLSEMLEGDFGGATSGCRLRRPRVVTRRGTRGFRHSQDPVRRRIPGTTPLGIGMVLAFPAIHFIFFLCLKGKFYLVNQTSSFARRFPARIDVTTEGRHAMMPLTSFEIARVLCQELPQHTSHCMEVLRQFGLIAFVLHDPDRHRAMGEILNEEYAWIDERTGRDLLVLAVFDTAVDALQRFGRRKYVRAISGMGRQVMHEPCRTSPERNRAALLAITSSLGIPFEALPCILLTRPGPPSHRDRGDFPAPRRHDAEASPSFIWLPTSCGSLPGQLQGYGAVASDAKRHPGETIQALFRYQVSALPGDAVASSVGQALCAALSSMARDGTHSGPGREKEVLIRELLRGWSSDMPQSRRDLHAAALLSHVFLTQVTESLESDSELARELNLLLDPIAQTYLQTALHIHDELCLWQRKCNLPSDAGPVVIQLGRVFERTVNLSLVHVLRQSCGIYLPNFFDRCQPGVYARIDGVDLNAGNGNARRDDAPWVGPDLGTSQRLCLERLAKLKPDLMPADAWRVLADNWETIRSWRNWGAHDRAQPIDNAKPMIACLTSLLEAGVFRDLQRIRHDVSGYVLTSPEGTPGTSSGPSFLKLCFRIPYRDVAVYEKLMALYPACRFELNTSDRGPSMILTLSEDGEPAWRCELRTRPDGLVDVVGEALLAVEQGAAVTKDKSRDWEQHLRELKGEVDNIAQRIESSAARRIQEQRLHAWLGKLRSELGEGETSVLELLRAPPCELSTELRQAIDNAATALASLAKAVSNINHVCSTGKEPCQEPERASWLSELQDLDPTLQSDLAQHRATVASHKEHWRCLQSLNAACARAGPEWKHTANATLGQADFGDDVNVVAARIARALENTRCVGSLTAKERQDCLHQMREAVAKILGILRIHGSHEACTTVAEAMETLRSAKDLHEAALKARVREACHEIDRTLNLRFRDECLRHAERITMVEELMASEAARSSPPTDLAGELESLRKRAGAMLKEVQALLWVIVADVPGEGREVVDPLNRLRSRLEHLVSRLRTA